MTRIATLKTTDSEFHFGKITSSSDAVFVECENGNGELLAYVGLSDQPGILAFGMAIVRAMDPEALVENQKDPAPIEQGYDVPALVASVADLEERVAALEAPAPTSPSPSTALWGYNIGDRVAYTTTGVGTTGTVRVIGAVRTDFSTEPYLRLDHEDGRKGIGAAYRPSEIRPA